MALTDKQQRFIDEYCIDQNATQAYQRAGYKVRSDRVAEANSSRLLSNAIIRGLVDAGLARLATKTRLTAEAVWAESRCIATSDIGEIFDFTGDRITLRPASDIPESARRAIKSMKIKVERYTEGNGDDSREVELTEMEVILWDKPGQLYMTLKALGELKEKHEHSVRDGAPMPVPIVTIIRFQEHEPRAEQPGTAPEYQPGAVPASVSDADGGGGGGRSNAEATRASA